MSYGIRLIKEIITNRIGEPSRHFVNRDIELDFIPPVGMIFNFSDIRSETVIAVEYMVEHKSFNVTLKPTDVGINSAFPLSDYYEEHGWR